VVNTISTLEGQGAKFVQAEYRTYASIFPYVYLFPVESSTDTGLTQNIMLVAVKSATEPELRRDENVQLQDYLSHRYSSNIPSNTPILTDDFAPVDNYIIKLIPSLSAQY